MWQLKDRSRISYLRRREHISSIEVEDVLFDLPRPARCRGGAAPGREMGRDALRLVEMKPGHRRNRRELMEWCRAALRRV